ncbi:MAG: CBS domain-containing protein [Gammaproteobacteria bacterium]|nr:CBS domain-containing protein [Gammaproteobacteria bacterium]
MSHSFTPLSHIGLQPDVSFERPPQPPYLSHREGPALEAMTDFKYVDPVTVAPATPIDEALDKMKRTGVRSLLVTGAEQVIVGLVTAGDIQGEKPIKLSQENRIPHSEFTVEMVMTPQRDIVVLNYLSVRNAQIGHIQETLHQLGRQHILVVHVDEQSGEQQVCGMFSTSQINKQLHIHTEVEVARAHSLAEIVHERN